MLAVAEARAHIVAAMRPLPAERVMLADALGRTLAEDVSARTTHPPAAVSAMDGYAVHAADAATAPVRLRLIGESSAGRRFSGSVGGGECVRIFTGAPIPFGTDAIVIQEDTESDGKTVTIRLAAKAGEWVRPAGLDFKVGDVLLKAGTILSGRDIGLAAAMNVPWLAVRRRPRVALIATGNEIVLPGDPLGPDQIVSSNSVALAAYVRAVGGEPWNLGIARDEPAALAALLDAGRAADLIVTSGGASVGDYDLVRGALGEHGLDLGFWKIAMRPGKPLIFGRYGETPVIGLPGNPVSCGVCAVVFLRPALAALLGANPEPRPNPTAKLGRDLPANDKREDYLRSSLVFGPDGDAIAIPFPRQDSSMLANLARADCLVIRPPHAPAINAGERVEIVPLRDGLLSI